MTIRVPFNRPSFVGPEWSHVQEALKSGHISGDGVFTRRVTALLEAAHPGSRALLTTSCTHALEMCALLLNIGSGDEVVLPSFTFVSTANAFALRGASLRFADIRPDTLTIDPEQVKALVTPRTRAVVVVHYGGVACDMEAIATAARGHRAVVVEDNAHGLFGRYRGRALGTLGALATLSFHETKNFTCGEGGALLVNDSSLMERAEVLREKGTDRSKFFRGQVDKYTWRDLGSSYLPSDILAAILLAQLEAKDSIQSARRRLWERYASELKEWALSNGCALPEVPSDREQAYHMFHMVMPSQVARDGLISFLRERGILAVFHYLPLHLAPYARRMGFDSRALPVTETVSGRLVRLPFFTAMSTSDQDDVISAVLAFRP